MESRWILQKKTGIHSIHLGIDFLWFLAPLVTFGLLVSFYPVEPNDFWWHLKIGQIIYTTHSIPAANLFAWSLPINQPYVYGEWLSEFLFYLSYHLGGLSLTIFIKNLLLIIAFGMVGFEGKRQSGSWRIGGIVMVLACAMAANNLLLRPQVFAWIPFVAFLILLNAFTSRGLNPGLLLLCPLIMVFWVNVHGSFILGLILIGIFFVGEVIRYLLKQDRFLSLKEIKYLALTGFLTLVATLVNPQFINKFGYVYKMMTDKSSQTLIVEWQSPAPNSYATFFFFISILLLIVFFTYSRYRPKLTEMLLILAFLWLAWSGMRYVVWFGMVAMPILGKSLKELIQKKSWLAIPPKNLLNSTLAVILFLPLILVQPWFIDRLPLPDHFWKNIALHDNRLGPMVSVSTPVDAVEYLQQHPGGKLFNEMGFGSYLIWSLPDQGVFIDTRVELYPYDQWLDYMKIVKGNQYNPLLQKYGVNRILINTKDQEELIKLLKTDPIWHLEYSDATAQLWAKN